MEKESKTVKYIFITGGVASSLGKGVSISSIGTLLEAHGYSVTIQKIDPYINVDPGTMSPHQHGEVYVTKDGAETDLDLGYYERFTKAKLTKENSVTTGQIYHSVIQREREGEYLGTTVQVIPHITNEIKNRILIFERNQKEIDFVLVEIGGTVGDIESVPFLEAIRQMRLDLGHARTLYVHLTLLPKIYVSGEVKSKPAQHSVKELLKSGIQPDIMICRCTERLEDGMKQKISLFCNIPPQRVISAPDLKSTIYEIPLLYKEEKLDHEILTYFNLKDELPMLNEQWNPLLQEWSKIVHITCSPKRIIKIAIVGKYMSVIDAYRSIYEALYHGAIANEVKVEFIRISSDELHSNDIIKKISGSHGLLVPGGFGERGIRGKISAIQYARENKIPFLGICLGMQCSVIEFARNVLKWKQANSTEFEEDTPYPVITLMEDQLGIVNKGGTMRLGSYSCNINKNTLLENIYQTEQIEERHRHRFEFNNQFREDYEKNGMKLSGVSPDNMLVEVVELDTDLHPWFVASQFHPEFNSSPLKPHKLFQKFIEHSLKNRS